MPAAERRISVVLPVYNEDQNIETCLRRLWSVLEKVEHEILVCYDFEEDRTLGAMAAMPDRPPSVRLVRNDLGPGVAFALQAGFRAAAGDVIVTTMADLSDPPELIPLMAARIRDEGADVVSGSRYVAGGAQHGGPRLKGFLSRLAGLSLRWVAGLGTRDATTNFRAYSRTLLDQVPITSRKGFEVALELTVKAHLRGSRVVEIPSTWTDRAHGASRFRLFKWLPHYLRWYASAMAAPVVVAAVWLALSVGLFHLVRTRGLDIPYRDEWALVPFVTGDKPVTATWLWAPHDEHRIPLTKLLYLTTVWASGGRFRAPQYVNAFALSLLALVLILVARRLRGRTALTDAFLPLTLLHWGHVYNVAWGFQIGLVLPALLLGILMALFAPSRKPGVGERRRLWGMAAVGASVLATSLALAEWAGSQGRYILLASLILAWAYLVALATRSGQALRLFHLCLFMLCLAFYPHTRAGYAWAGERLEDSRALRAEAIAGLPPEEIAARHPGNSPDAQTMAAGLVLLRARSLGPYRPGLP